VFQILLVLVEEEKFKEEILGDMDCLDLLIHEEKARLSIDLTDEHIMIDASQHILVLDSTAYLGAHSLCIEYSPYRQNKIDPQ
jgi:hypothetical protein